MSRKAYYIFDSIEISFWPSLTEINESRAAGTYQGRLTEFYESLDQLDSDLRDMFFTLKTPKERNSFPTFLPYDSARVKDGRKIMRHEPPTIVTWLVKKASVGAIFAGAIQLLRSWLKGRTDRKIKVRLDTLNIEATNLTVEEFGDLLKLVFELQNSEESIPRDKLKATLKKLGYEHTDGETSFDSHLLEIKQAVRRTNRNVKNVKIKKTKAKAKKLTG